MQESNENDNRFDEGQTTLCPNGTTTGPTREIQGKSKDINEITGIPELDIEIDDDVDEVALEKETETMKQSTEPRNRDNEIISDDETETDDKDDMLQIQQEDVDEEIEFWNQAVVCFILGANPPWEVVEGFIK
ncbi:hypothetical protein vseg_000908 [Gypsophila vaccaria]